MGLNRDEGSPSASQLFSGESGNEFAWDHDGEETEEAVEGLRVYGEGKQLQWGCELDKFKSFWKRKRVKMNGLKCLGNKYPQVIFDPSHTRIQEFQLEGIISNYQSYGPD